MGLLCENSCTKTRPWFTAERLRETRTEGVYRFTVDCRTFVGFLVDGSVVHAHAWLAARARDMTFT